MHSSDKQTDLTKEQCQNFFQTTTSQLKSSFDLFLDYANKQLRYVRINETNWKLSACSCSICCKYYKCKHVIAACYQSNKCNIPDQAKQIQIG